MPDRDMLLVWSPTLMVAVSDSALKKTASSCQTKIAVRSSLFSVKLTLGDPSIAEFSWVEAETSNIPPANTPLA